MDSSAMDLGVYNASIQYGDRIYSNTSGLIAEQSNGNSADRMVYDDEENYVIKHFESSENKSPGYEVITVDPNCFYSSDDDDIVVDIESDQSETNTEHDSESSAQSVNENQYPLMTQPLVLRSFEHQPSTGTAMDDIPFDYNNVNISDLYAVDDHLLNAHDEILFANSGIGDLGQFDLANYVDGASSSLLLSPPPPVRIARKCTPLKIPQGKKPMNAFHRNRGVDDSPELLEQQNSKLIVYTQPATVAAGPNGVRRKRRNLTAAFIDTTDDSASENEATQNKKKIQQSKKHPRKDDDPVWNPVPNGNSRICGKAKIDATKTKDSSIATKADELSKDKCNEKSKSPSKPSSSGTAQSNGLRAMLKKQLLSNRPMKKNPIKSSAKLMTSNPNAVNETKRKFGVGRGKDISITAKYFNSSAKSSDNSDRDNTDNINLNVVVESSSESESDVSESSVRSNERIREEDNIDYISAKSSVENVIVDAKNHAVEQTVNGNHSKSNEVKPTVKASTQGPALVENIDFAKAIFVDAKETAKVKPVKRDDFKKSASEQPMKRPPIPFNTGNKFKTNCLPIVACSRPFTELQAPNGIPRSIKAKSLSDVCAKQEIKLPKIPLRRPVTAEQEIEKIRVEDVKIEIDVVSVDETRSDTLATSKKKLNIQEYLKRKSINPLASGKVKVCREEHSYGKPAETATVNENGQMPTNEMSLYEEIISVSMGCGTDISIPEFRVDGADASTVLLSDIQTTIEKAAIEQGKISSSSLISSIQDVILKKTTIKIETDNFVDEMKPATKNEDYEHGENKVIMHLRKDRIRPATVTIAIQTEPYFQFPPLERIAPLSRKNENFHRCKSLGRSSLGDTAANDVRSMRAYSMQHELFANRHYRARKDHSESSYYSDDDGQQLMSSPQRRSRHSEYLESIAHPSVITNSHTKLRRRHKRSGSYKKGQRYRSKFDRDSQRHRTISRSLSQSSDTSSSSQTSTSTTGSSATVSSASSKSLNSYGDSSTKSYYADEHCERPRNRSTQNWSRGPHYQQKSKPRTDSPEHRRIVYVGRIESETTKDDLRRIFSVYGRVENVTIHYKEMKWKYGFVTFERPADAYKVIDTSSKNPALKDYDISFGGRRTFCREKYLDLDNTEDDYSQSMHPMAKKPQRNDDSFEALLRKLKEKLKDSKQ